MNNKVNCKVLFSLIFVLFSSTIYSQTIKINFDKTPLKIVLESIEKQSDYTFYYDNSVINADKEVTISLEESKLSSVLDKLFNPLKINYSIKGNKIILAKKVISYNKSTVDVEGVVYLNSLANPQPGVSVVLKGTQKGVITDFDGKFSIQAIVGQVLNFTFIGAETKEIVVSEDNLDLKIILKESLTKLNEVVLTSFGKKTKKEVVTGAINNVKIEEIENSATSSLQESLQGSVSGVLVTSSSGDAGSNPNVRIRGVGSIEASGYPIYVVDGVILSSQEVAAISSSEVESISVLKDAAATSIYGTKGANGVILIKTKSGKLGKTVYKLSSQYALINPVSLGSTKPLNTQEYAELLREGLINAGLASTDEQANEFLDTQTNFNRNQSTDWYNTIIRQAVYKKVYFSASGGTIKNKYRFSVGYQNREGVVYNNDYDRITAKVKMDLKLTKKLSFKPSIFISKRVRNKFRTGGSSYNPIRSLYRIRPDIADDELFEADKSNPSTIFKEYLNKSTDFNIISSASINYKINEHLNANTLLSSTLRFVDAKEVLPKSAGVFSPLLTVYNKNEKDINTSVRGVLTYSNKFKKHSITSFAGFEMINEEDNSYYLKNLQVLPDLTQTQGNFPSDASTVKYVANNTSLFLNTQYTYSKKYLLSASLRRDGSSRFGKGNKYGTFWSVGMGWNIHREDFMDNVFFVDKLKVRASYGVNGQDRIGTYPSIGVYSDINYGYDIGLYPSQISNPNLKWEVNKPLDFGLDFSLFDYRFSGSFDWYSRITSDLIVDVPISSVNGQDQMKRNVGFVKNSGIETNLSFKILKDNDVKWTTNFTYSKNQNKVLEINDNNNGIDQIIHSITRISNGKPLNTFFLVGYAGVNPQTGEAQWYTDESKTAITTNYNEAQKFDQGSANPDFYGSFTNLISYDKLKLSFQFYTSWGGKVFDNAGNYLHNDGYNALNYVSTNVARNYYNNRWQHPGDNAKYPKYVYHNPQSGNPNQRSTRFLYDGSYIRLKNISLSYTFPQELIKRANLTRLKLFLRGTNVWTYVKDKYLQIDPEAGISGVLDQKVPISSTYSLGLEIKF